MTARERVAAFGSRSTIAGWAAISLSPKSYRSARYRVCRPLDYPARLGLDLPVSAFRQLVASAFGQVASAMLRDQRPDLGPVFLKFGRVRDDMFCDEISSHRSRPPCRRHRDDSTVIPARPCLDDGEPLF